MRTQSKSFVLTAASLFATLTFAQAQSVDPGSLSKLAPSIVFNLSTAAYDNLSTAATAGFSEPNANNPKFGDALNLTQGGNLAIFGCSLYNPTSGGNTGSILTGNMVVNFYNNTVPYAGGAISGALLGSATLGWDFTGNALPAGFYVAGSFDLSSLNINLTQNILVTQQFTQLTGTSTRNGVVLFSNPTIGSSPNTVYIKSAATAEGLYSFAGNPGQFGYHVEVVPEPSSVCLLGLGFGAWMVARLRGRRTA